MTTLGIRMLLGSSERLDTSAVAEAPPFDGSLLKARHLKWWDGFAKMG